jgi:hypothetical protein
VASVVKLGGEVSSRLLTNANANRASGLWSGVTCSLGKILDGKRKESNGVDKDAESIRNLKKNRIIYGRMVQRWFLLHLSVGCHIFFLSFFMLLFSLSILLIIIVKCLFILAAVFPAHISLAISRREGVEEEGFDRRFFCGNQNRISSLLHGEKICSARSTQGMFSAEKLLRSRRGESESRRMFVRSSCATIFPFLVTCLCTLRCEGISCLCPFVSEERWARSGIQGVNGLGS